jgi:hypothetical protein
MLEQAVTSNLAPITAKLCKMIRMLASDCDGDVIAAARAIKRTLRSEGLDIHELAKGIEEPNGGTLRALARERARVRQRHGVAHGLARPY